MKFFIRKAVVIVLGFVVAGCASNGYVRVEWALTPHDSIRTMPTLTMKENARGETTVDRYRPVPSVEVPLALRLPVRNELRNGQIHLSGALEQFSRIRGNQSGHPDAYDPRGPGAISVSTEASTITRFSGIFPNNQAVEFETRSPEGHRQMLLIRATRVDREGNLLLVPQGGH